MTAQQAAAATPVLVGLGEAGAPGAGGLPPLQRVAQLLAGRLGRPPLALDPQIGPDPALAALAAAAAHGSGGSGSLACLPLDVGLPLADGRCWAEALGAWRQPCLLVIGAPQLATGWPAAGSALLGQWRVPLLGLLQWGGRWDAPLRRRDGLPWLGLLPDPQAITPPLEASDPASEAQQAEEQLQAELGLANALALRLRQLPLG